MQLRAIDSGARSSHAARRRRGLWPMTSMRAQQSAKLPTIGVHRGAAAPSVSAAMDRRLCPERHALNSVAIGGPHRRDTSIRSGGGTNSADRSGETRRPSSPGSMSILIVTWFTPAALWLQSRRRVTFQSSSRSREIPFANGLVVESQSARRQRHGMSGVNAELSGKSVELIRDMSPSAHRMVALANASDPLSKPFLEQIEAGGRATGIVIDPKMLRSPEELETAFADMGKKRPDAVIVQPSLPTPNVSRNWREIQNTDRFEHFVFLLSRVD